MTAISRVGAEGVNCLAIGGKKNEWLVAGCNNGCVYFLNLITARKWMIEGFCEGDI